MMMPLYTTFPDKTTLPVSTETRFRLFLDLAIQAPSFSASPRWRFKIRQHQLDFWIDLSGIDADDTAAQRAAYIDAGLVLYYLKTVIKGSGLEPVVFTFPDFEKSDLIAYIWLGPSVKTNTEDMERFNWLILTHGSRKAEPQKRTPTRHMNLAELVEHQEGFTLDFHSEEQKLILRDTANHPAAWLNAGMTLARVCLDAAINGLHLQPSHLDAPLSQAELTVMPSCCDPYDQRHDTKRSLLDFLL